MDKTKGALERYPRWTTLQVYIDRVNLTKDTDFPRCIGHAKCLIEAVGKEICDWQEKELPKTPDLRKVVRTAFQALGIASGHHLVQIANSFAAIGQELGTLRNSIDISAHGKTLSEIERSQAETQHYTADFLVSSTDLVSSFLIETFEQFRLEKELEEAAEPEPVYLDFEDFNAAFDEQHGEVFIGDYSYQSSEVLFHIAPQAFETEHARHALRAENGEEE